MNTHDGGHAKEKRRDGEDLGKEIPIGVDDDLGGFGSSRHRAGLGVAMETKNSAASQSRHGHEGHGHTDITIDTVLPAT